MKEAAPVVIPVVIPICSICCNNWLLRTHACWSILAVAAGSIPSGPEEVLVMVEEMWVLRTLEEVSLVKELALI